VCVLFRFIKLILGNRYYVRSQGFIVSEPRETHPRSEITNVPTSPCPPLDNLGCPDPHPAPYLRRWLHQSPPLPLRTDPQLLRWQLGACSLAAPSSGQVQSSFGLIGEGPEWWWDFLRSKVPIVVKPSTAQYPKQHLFVFLSFFVKKEKKKKPEGEGAPAPEKPSLSHFHYGNTTELGATGQFVTSLDSSARVRFRTRILRV